MQHPTHSYHRRTKALTCPVHSACLQPPQQAEPRQVQHLILAVPQRPTLVLAFWHVLVAVAVYVLLLWVLVQAGQLQQLLALQEEVLALVQLQQVPLPCQLVPLLCQLILPCQLMLLPWLSSLSPGWRVQ
jgi:hypothetical protein